MKKRILSGLLSLLLIAGLLPTAALADEVIPDADLLSDDMSMTSTDDITRAQMAEMVYEHESLKTDIESMAMGGTAPEFTDLTECTDDQKTAITALCQAKIVSGTSATTFNPSGTVTRGEFVVVLWRATGSRSNNTAMTASFSDTLEPWYAPAVNCFYGAGLLNGTSGGTFDGSNNITVTAVNTLLTRYQEDKETFISNTSAGSTTRAEMTVEFYKKFQPELSKLEVTKTWEGNGPFTDLFGCTNEQVEAIQFFYERGIISGTTETTFHPHTPVSNFQIAALLQRCATASVPAGAALFSAEPLAEQQTAVEWLKEQGLDVSAAEKNPDAPALADTLTTWRDGLVPEAPTFSPASGETFEESQEVTISAAEGATIYCTTDNSAPDTSGDPYSEAFTITETTTVKAIAVKNNLISDTAEATYTKQTQEPEQPALTIKATPASLNGGGTVTLTVCNASDAVTVTCDDSEVSLAGSGGTWTASLPNASKTYTFTATGEDGNTAACTVTVTRYTSSGGSSSSSGSSNTTTETTKNDDGSTTTTVTNKTTGTVTETTKNTDGSTTTVETKKDGTVTTTEKAANGSTVKTVENVDGSTETTVKQADGTTAAVTTGESGRTEAQISLSEKAVDAAQGEAVALPIPPVTASRDSEDAPVVEVSLPRGSDSARVEIPVEDVTPGTVAVMVKADGTEEVIKTSLTTENGVAITLGDGDTVKIVDNSKDFIDTRDHWAKNAIVFAASRELFAGTTETTFSPDTAMTRAMLMTVLARFDGEDTTSGSTWYERGVAWAVANGLSDGSNPDGSITREQFAAMLYRYAGSPAVSGTLTGFSDHVSVSSYADDAMTWAVSTGIIDGMGNGTLAPQGSATRAQVAAMLMRFVERL